MTTDAPGFADGVRVLRDHARSAGEDTAAPVVSVVIPTYNRRDRLARVLAALNAQDLGRPYEVIVVSDGSTDSTAAFLASAACGDRLLAIEQVNAGPAVARNRGVELARADLVLFVDDDVVPAAGLLAAHIAAHEQIGASAVVVGPMLDPPDHEMSPWVRWEQRMLYKQYRALEAGEFEATFRQFYTGNASVLRTVLVEAGGFDTRLRRAEDVELGIRLFERGVRFAYEPRAKGDHYAMRSFASWRDIARTYGCVEVEFGQPACRRWQLEFMADKYTSAPAGVRAIVVMALRAPRLADIAAALAGKIAPALDRTPARKAAQAILSLVYATDYWRGAAEGAGGRAALATMVRTHATPVSRAVGAVGA